MHYLLFHTVLDKLAVSKVLFIKKGILSNQLQNILSSSAVQTFCLFKNCMICRGVGDEINLVNHFCLRSVNISESLHKNYIVFCQYFLLSQIRLNQITLFRQVSFDFQSLLKIIYFLSSSRRNSLFFCIMSDI